ncbi:unnamed protein product [Durusdinium trenchii]|uniref:Uncharacterized protein n=1 Tax=Durusdinium trenchii TaxID=1381693 RepID=A0ABP0JZF4_9DINO
MTRFAMALGALAFLWTIPAAATGTGYQKYISQYAGDYLHQFGQGSGYQDYIQTYTGMKSGAQTEEDTQPISLMADMSEGHTDKQESPSGAGYQKYMAQYANDFQKYMQGQGKGGAQGGDYQKYMAQFANDFEKYLQGQGKGGDYQKYMSQHMDDFQKYMQGQGKSTQSGEDKIGHVVEQKLKKDEGKDAGSSEAHHGACFSTRFVYNVSIGLLHFGHTYFPPQSHHFNILPSGPCHAFRELTLTRQEDCKRDLGGRGFEPSGGAPWCSPTPVGAGRHGCDLHRTPARTAAPH